MTNDNPSGIDPTTTSSQAAPEGPDDDIVLPYDPDAEDPLVHWNQWA